MIAFVSAVTNGDTPLNVLELLWVNLIMDAMAALGVPLLRLPKTSEEQLAQNSSCMVFQLLILKF